MSNLSNEEIIKELCKFDTATICNVVATYAGTDLCLSLYDSWRGEYYTDTSLHCMYPELYPVCGYAATAWYSDRRPENTDIGRWALPEHLDATPKPIILVTKQSYSPGLRMKSGLFGGNMTAQFKAFGVIGVVTNGPMRDLEEIRDQRVQYLAAGLTSGHGALQLRAAGTPLKVAGMIVQPGDIIHLDQCGAAKFPAKYLPKVLEYAQKLVEREAKNKAMFEESGFTLAKWKANVEGKKSS
ncbi:MAG: 4-hydroxy-4-methyl-2-oxoglutarate aldolase [Thermoproteota archaeon]|nr:4-hydroxy-4-methyl-2-oxoglutarate aldolase [Thermoproteota archaeon]